MLKSIFISSVNQIAGSSGFEIRAIRWLGTPPSSAKTRCQPMRLYMVKCATTRPASLLLTQMRLKKDRDHHH